ncbi:MAG: FtsX-like permease family protein [Candidatus Thorarchaeota archaeon]|nr:FtsX-like permease family protein [Candidatus Thorarchaeota archaeon]
MTVVSISAVKSKNLSKQFSVLRALGADTRPIMITTIVDAMLGLLMAAMIGLLIGLVLTSIILQMPLVYTGVSSTISWQRIPISLAIPIPLISGIIMLAVLFTAISTFIVTKNTLGKNIAEEIQHNE